MIVVTPCLPCPRPRPTETDGAVVPRHDFLQIGVETSFRTDESIAAAVFKGSSACRVVSSLFPVDSLLSAERRRCQNRLDI